MNTWKWERGGERDLSGLVAVARGHVGSEAFDAKANNKRSQGWGVFEYMHAMQREARTCRARVSQDSIPAVKALAMLVGSSLQQASTSQSM